jgi:hypothetical protein
LIHELLGALWLAGWLLSAPIITVQCPPPDHSQAP